jgi:hypothetical protein
MLDPASKEARRLRIHIDSDRAMGDRRVNVLASPYQPYAIKFEPLSTRGEERAGLRVRLNDKHTMTMLLDTGASGVSLSRGAAKRAGLEQLAAEADEMGGIGDQKKATMRHAVAGKISIGDLEFSNVSIRSMQRSDLGGSDGIIGADMFEQFLVTLDFPKRRLLLQPFASMTKAPDRDDDYDAAEQIEPGYHRFFRAGRLMLIPASISDRPIRMFLIDTGAGMNTVDPEAVRGVTALLRDDASVVRGVQGKVREVYRAKNISLRFANIQQSNENAYSFDLSHTSDDLGVELAGIIGIPVLSQLRLTIDYRNGAVRFEYNKGKER